MHSQLIHGKFDGENSGYKLVACTSDYEDNAEFIHTLFKNYHFWSPQGVEDGKAIGIFLLNETQLVLVKAALAEDENQVLLYSGTRNFYHHHYILVNRNENHTEILESNPIELLLRFLDQISPYFDGFNQPHNFQFANEKFWGAITSEIFQPISSKITEDQAKNIKQFSDHVDNQDRSFLLLLLGAILCRQKIILTRDDNVSDPVSLISDLLLLLPVSYRPKIAIAIGAVEENHCPWADIIIKTDKEPAYPLLEEFIWLDRSHKKVFGQYDLDFCNHRYLNDFIKNIYQQPEDIYRFIQHLDLIHSDTRNFTKDDFQKATSLIYLIEGLPIQYHAELLDKYILEICKSYSSVFDWQGIIKDFKNSESFWKALLKLFSEKKESIPTIKEIILSIINQVGIKKALQKLQEVKQIKGLSYSLIKINLLNIYPDELENSNLNQYLVDICQESVQYIRDFYLAQNSLIELNLFINLIKESNRYKKIFPSGKEEFKLLSNTLKPEFSSEIIKILVNQYLAIKLPYADNKFFSSELYCQTLSKFSSIKNWAKYFTTERIKSFDYLPSIAQEIELEYPQADLMYSNFLDSFSPQYENACGILVNIIKKAITNNQEIVGFSKIDIRLFSNQIKLFPRTYQWFKNNSPELKEKLIIIENEPENWHSWNALIKFIKSNSLDRISLAEYLLENIFSNKVLIKWLEALKRNYDLKTVFFKSSTWNNLNLETVLEFVKDEDPKWIKVFTCLVIEHFPQDEKHLQSIIPTLLNYLSQLYLKENNLSIQDQELWKRLIEPSFIQYLSNRECLNIFPLKWHLEIYYDFIVISSELNNTEKKALFSIAKDHFDFTDDPRKKLQLFKDIHKYLDNFYLKKFAIDLIGFCSESNEVTSLIKLLKEFNFNNIEIKEILAKVNRKICDYNLLDLFFSYLKSEPISEYDKKLIEIVLVIPLRNQEQKDKMRIFLHDYICKCEDIKLVRYITDQLIDRQYLFNLKQI